MEKIKQIAKYRKLQFSNYLQLALIIFLALSPFPCFANPIKSQRLKLCFFDIDASLPLSKTRLNHIVKNLKQSNSDIIIMAGVKNESDFKTIKSQVPDFVYSQIVNAEDKTSHLTYLAKKHPEHFKGINYLKYVIKDGIKLPLQKGFIYAVIKKNNYLLHILGADLKNRKKHPIYNQTDMRRYEARQLRHLATAILKKDKQANILILANLNDNYNKSPVKDIYNRRFGIVKRLFDLRPLDKIQVSWTYLEKTSDEYERLDYAIISSPLIPEIIIEQTKIIDCSEWQKASSHRPLTVTISCIDRPLWTKEKITTIFPNAIRTPEYVKTQQ